MPALKDVKLERYAQGLFQGMSQRDAFLKAYPAANRWKPTTVDVRASRVKFDHPEICERVEELQEEAAQAVIMTVRERLVTLSEIARDEDTNVKFRIAAIDTLNKMDGTYLRNSAPRDVQGVTIINDTQTGTTEPTDSAETVDVI